MLNDLKTEIVHICIGYNRILCFQICVITKVTCSVLDLFIISAFEIHVLVYASGTSIYKYLVLFKRAFVVKKDAPCR